MLREAVDGRRLRFPVELQADESVPGLIARATRQHVLIRTGAVLDAAGVAMKHAGYSQLGTPDELRRISHVIRCPSEELVDRSGARVVAPDTSRSVDARFGRLILPRVHLELDRRRIAPRSLQECGYHRLGWMNLLLPYCGVSFERMVSSCNSCGATLGWRYARGIGHCDWCGLEIAPSNEAGLPAELQQHYRLFAQLSSLHGDAIDTGVAQLAKPLRQVSPGVLLQLTLMVGSIVAGKALVTGSRNEVATLERPVLASIAAKGIELMQNWPDGIKSWVSMKTDELRGSSTELLAIRKELKRLVDRKYQSADFISIVSDALPELLKRAAHGLAGGRRYYLYGDVDRLLGLDAPQMERLRDWLGDKYLQSRKSFGRQFGQFDADLIDKLAPVFRNTMAINSCASKLRLPIYAVEQFCQTGLLRWENHPATIAVRACNQVGRESFDTLRKALIERSRDDQLPSRSVSLPNAVKRLGGRLKPWDAIVRSLLEREIPFWLASDEPQLTGIYVRPEDMEPFDQISVSLPDVGFRSGRTVSQLDAAEILNIQPVQFHRRAKELNLNFEKEGRALVVPMEDILGHARQIAWNAEIAWHLGVRHNRIDDILRAKCIERRLAGWSRPQLIEEGVLPAVPTA